MRFRALLLSIAVACAPTIATTSRAAGDGIVRESVSFVVTNPTDGSVWTLAGTLVRPREGCTGSVLLAMHGLSYGQWAWDFPIEASRYSVAQALAERGYALVAIDELGYGATGSTAAVHPNGYSISVEAYADMTAQIGAQLRAGSYGGSAFSHVGLIGHSAGAEIVEDAAALHPELFDLLIPTAYTHEPYVNNDWLMREWSQDNLRAAQDDYEYFETDAATRASDMYDLTNDRADPSVVAYDTAHANLTPSGEVFSIGSQPSRFLLASIKMPVLLVLAENDALFPASFGAQELTWFAPTTDVSLLVAPQAGHVFMLQRNASATNSKIADWLDAHAATMPAC